MILRIFKSIMGGVIVSKILRYILFKAKDYKDLIEGFKNILDYDKALIMASHAIREVGYSQDIIPIRWKTFNYWGIKKGGNFEAYRCFLCGVMSYLYVLKKYFPSAFNGLMNNNIYEFVGGLRSGVLGAWTNTDTETYYNDIINIYNKLKGGAV